MDLDQLNGRYLRLKDELASAYAQQPWPTGRIDRLAEEIAQTEHAIAAFEAQTPGSSARDSADKLPDGVPAPASTVPPVAGKPASRTPSVARNRLTPFGTRLPQSAAD